MSPRIIPRWQYIALVLLGVATFVLVLLVFRGTNEGLATQRAQRAAAQAAECRADIASGYAALADRRDNLGWAALLASYAAPQSVPALAAQLDTVIDQIGELPTRADAYRDGVTIDGQKYRPCTT